MVQDLVYAMRSLLRSRLITIAAVLTLGAGIGGATAVFSVVEAVVLRPLPFHQPDRLVRLWELTRDGDRFSFSEPTYLDLRVQLRSLDSVAAYDDLGGARSFGEAGDVERIQVVPISASLPGLLGVAAQLGRTFDSEADRPGARRRVIVVSDNLWRRRLGASPQVVDSTVTLDGQPWTVAGVMPRGFDFPGGADAWIPLAANPSSDRGDKSLAVIGRLAPGVTLDQLRGELRTFAGGVSAAHPESNGGWSADVARFDDWLVAPDLRRAVWVLFAAVGLLLLLACANVANLLMAQAVSRQQEMRVRGALGASPGRLVRQLLTESALLAFLGTAAGVLLSIWCIDLVQILGAGRVPRLEGLQINGAVLAFACVAGAVSCLLFGLAPAAHAARVDLRTAMDAGGRYTAGGRTTRSALVVAEVALAMLLVVGAGLLGRSLVRLLDVDPGFDATDTIALTIDLPASRYPEARVAGFYRDLLDRLRGTPGVAAAGATSTNPFRQFGFSNSVTPEERAAQAPPSGLVQAGWRSVTPGFFEALRIPVLAGRSFTGADTASGERVAIVGASLAHRLWPGESAIGKRVFWGDTTGRTRTIVGVVGDIRDVQLDAVPTPLLFVPHAQVDLPSMAIVVRAEVSPAELAPRVRTVLREMDPALPSPAIEPVNEGRTALAAGPRFNVALLAVFAVIALVLAVSGVYAMLAFTVSERRRELAVRLALGASAAQVRRQVLRGGLLLAAIGAALGALAAVAATRVLTGLLFEVEPTDPLTFAASAAGLLACAGLACWLPARHASRTNTLLLLRE